MDMETGFSLILSELKEIRQDLNDFKQETNSRFDKLEVRMDNLEGRMDNLETSLQETNIRLDHLEVRMDNLETGQAEIKQQLAAVAAAVTIVQGNTVIRMNEMRKKEQELEHLIRINCFDIAQLRAAM